jgi:hypothetical protein
MTIDVNRDLEAIKALDLDDYPNQRDEYRVQQGINLAGRAVRDLADRFSETSEEQDAIEFGVAADLIAHAQGRMNAAVLRQRILARVGQPIAPAKRPRHLDLDQAESESLWKDPTVCASALRFLLEGTNLLQLLDTAERALIVAAATHLEGRAV